MNILKRGKIPPDPMEAWAELTCQNCRTVFEFQRKEAKSGGRPGDEPELYVNCPLCRHHTGVTTFDFFHRTSVEDAVSQTGE